MSDEVSKFCDSVHEKLETLQGRMDSLKLNIGTTWHLLQEKLEEVRRRGQARQSAVAEARARLEQWYQQNESETKSTINQRVDSRDNQMLASRAQATAESAWVAILLAEASIDDVERMVLEAIVAQREAEAATSDRPEGRRESERIEESENRPNAPGKDQVSAKR